MTFCEKLNQELEALDLLKHPFYQLWNHGELSMDTLQVYAKEYYHHVAAFPRYLSNIHTSCADLKSRQILLGNLMDEELGEDNHPALWIRFAEGLGVSAADCQQPATLEKTHQLVDGYFDLVKTDYATGLGALYAYERQTPRVAESKIEGLKAHYNITHEQALQFFTVHMQADEWHTEEVAALIEGLCAEDQEKVRQGALAGANLLWSFLDGMMETTHAH